MTCTITDYISTKRNYSAKILAIDLLIDKMLLSLAEGEAGPIQGISEYQLDDGQVKIRTAYTSLAQVQAGITALEQMKQRYQNKMDGRSVILRDVNAFKRRR